MFAKPAGREGGREGGRERGRVTNKSHRTLSRTSPKSAMVAVRWQEGEPGNMATIAK